MFGWRYKQILGYGFDNIDAKIAGLKERGFDNPTKLITSSPTILGLAFDNIDAKIRLLYLLHGDRTKAISELQTFPSLLGYKWRRLLFAVRTSNPAPRATTPPKSVMQSSFAIRALPVQYPCTYGIQNS